jgi:hypothetical protein
MTHQLGSASYFLSPCPGRRVAVNELPSHRPLPNGSEFSCAAQDPHTLMLDCDGGERNHLMPRAPRQIQFVVRQLGGHESLRTLSTRMPARRRIH